MLTIGQQKVDTLTLAILVFVIAAIAALSFFVPILMPWGIVAFAGAGFLLYWAIKWDVSVWAWLWVISFGLLDWPGWRIEMAGFFNLTVPRLVFITAGGLILVHFVFRQWRIRYDRNIMWVMGALLVYVALNATATGWTAQTEEVSSAPYFRFMAGFLLPFLMFFLVYNSTFSERNIGKGLIILTLYGWYAIYLGYLQYAAIRGYGGARTFIFPSYINDPTFGIHFDRARGAFAAVGPQAIFLVLLFYVDLYLIRILRGLYRAAIVVQAILVVPAIFFTGLRSSYLAFLLCGVVWCLWANRRRFGWSKLAVAALVLAILVGVFWGNLSQTDRSRGGIAQRGPVESRKILIGQTWEMFKDSPLTGVGFGHFVDAQQKIKRDPSARVSLYTGVLVEHNLFLGMLAETGIIGCALTIAVFAVVFRQSLLLYSKIPATAQGWLCRALVVLFWVAIVNFITDAMFRNTLWDPFANALFWTFAGFIVGYNRLLEPKPVDIAIAAPLG